MQTKVYYGDTDAGGVVYYANYLRWLEMGRFELLERCGMSVERLAAEGTIFAVARLEIEYRVPAVLGDVVRIDTKVDRIRRVRFTVDQHVIRVADEQLLTVAKVMLACIDPTGKLLPLSEELITALQSSTAMP